MINNIVAAVAAIGGIVTTAKVVKDSGILKNSKTEKVKLGMKYANDSADSIVEYTRLTRCEPIAMIDHTIILNPVLPDLMGTLTHIYAVMYSQAFSLAINARIGDINIVQILDKINPNRDLKRVGLAIESHSLMLPDYRKDRRGKSSVTLESRNNDGNKGKEKFDPNNPEHRKLYNKRRVDIYDNDQDSPNYKPETHQVGVDTGDIVKFHSNLTTGITFNVSVNLDKRSIEIPVTMRVLANSITNDNIISILEAGVVNRTVKERWRGWRSGELAFWKDLVLCRDILKADRANQIKDKTGLYAEITRRRNTNTMASIASGDPSISQVSNILVINQSTIDEFERVSLKRITNAKVRETLFNATQIMIMAIVDNDMETVTIYYHDITIPTTVTFRELKANSKKGNVDPMEILKAYQMGNGIRL